MKFFHVIAALWPLIWFGCSVSEVISFDFGTEFIKAAIKIGSRPVEILTVNGSRKIPSLIGIKDKIRYFGANASILTNSNPEKTFPYLPKLIGRTMDDQFVQLYRKFINPSIVMHPTRNSLAFPIDGIGLMTVEELLALIVEHFLEAAQQIIPYQKTVEFCVISVPYGIPLEIKQRYRDIATMVGLEVREFTVDVAAVALDYAIYRNVVGKQKILFLDVGSGKTCTSLVEIDAKKLNYSISLLNSISSDIGALDLTFALREESLKDRKDIGIEDMSSKLSYSRKFLAEFDNAKIRFSTVPKFKMDIQTRDDIFKFDFCRDDFEEKALELLQKIVMPIEHVLSLTKGGIDSISAIIPLGAGSRLPWIGNWLKNKFGSRYSPFLNADDSHALGAGLRATMLSRNYRIGFKANFIIPIGHSLIISGRFSDGSTFEADDLFNDNPHYGTAHPYKLSKLLNFSFSIRNPGNEKPIYEGKVDDIESQLKKITEKTTSINSTLIITTSLDGFLSFACKIEYEYEHIKVETVTPSTATPTAAAEPTPTSTADSQTPTMASEDQPTATDASSPTQSVPPPVPVVQTKTLMLKKEVSIKISSQDHLHVISESDLKDSKKHIAVVLETEKNQRNLDNAHNTLESLIMESESNLENADFSSFLDKSAEKSLRKNITDSQSGIEGSFKTLKDFQSHIKVFEEILKDTNWKIEQFEGRESSISTLKNLLEECKKLHDETLKQESRGTLTPTDLEGMLKTHDSVSEWLASMVSKQEKLEKNAKPVLTLELLRTKSTELTNSMKFVRYRLSQIPPPIVPPPTPESTAQPAPEAEQPPTAESAQEAQESTEKVPASSEFVEEEMPTASAQEATESIPPTSEERPEL